MDSAAMEGILTFIRRAENLKNTLRFAFTSTGRRESAAEHSWRLCLLVLLCADSFPGLNHEKCFKLAVIHDLAESICGDVPAVFQERHEKKSAAERAAMAEITLPLPEHMRQEIFGLWEEYEAGATDEAVFVKALDKLETLIQHTQGQNPPDFDYAFNLTYGLDCTNKNDLFVKLRAIIDGETKSRIT